MKLNRRRSIVILIVLSISCLASMRSTASGADLPLCDSPRHSTNGFLDSTIEVPIMKGLDPEAVGNRGPEGCRPIRRSFVSARRS